MPPATELSEDAVMGNGLADHGVDADPWRRMLGRAKQASQRAPVSPKGVLVDSLRSESGTSTII